MTERLLQNALYNRLINSGQRILCPNYTPAGWWECDLFTITRAGFWTEYEIKISLSDFKADAQKARRDWSRVELRYIDKNKHAMLSSGHADGPSRFFYILPEELAAKVELPPFAGLMVAHERRGHIRIRPVKSAPRLHKLKASPELFTHVQSVFCARYWNLRRGLKEDAAA